MVSWANLIRNRKLLISRAPTKVKSQGPAYSQALNQNKIIRQRSRSRESGRKTVRRLWWMVLGVEAGREVWGRPVLVSIAFPFAFHVSEFFHSFFHWISFVFLLHCRCICTHSIDHSLTHFLK